MTGITYLSGYYGMLNSGDDALMLAAALGAQRYAGAEQLRISAYRKVSLAGIGEFPQRLCEPQNFRGENRLRNYWQSLRSNQVIFGGGSVLHSLQDISIKRQMIKLAGRGVAVGVSLGPFENTQAELACQKFLNECQFVGLRDVKSYEMAKSLSHSSSLALTFDLAPQLLLHQEFSNVQVDLPAHTRKGICVCLCPSERLKQNPEAEQRRLKALALCLANICQKTGEPLTLLDFNGHTQLGDAQVHAELLAYLPDTLDVSHIAYQDNPIRVMQTLSQFKLVIGMRLHACILAFLVKTPVFSMNYHQKCQGWCDQIGLAKSLQLSLQEPWSAENSQHLIDQILQGLDNEFPMPELTPSQALEKSLLNWRYCDEYSAEILSGHSTL